MIELIIILPDDHPQSDASLVLFLEPGSRERVKASFMALELRCFRCFGTLPKDAKYCIWCSFRSGIY
jgi:hypothetical protein